MTFNSITAELARRYRQNQDGLLELIGGLTDDQIGWSPNETTPSVGFHVRHLARWADYLQELFNGRGSQIWETEGLAGRWNMATQSLGYAQTGMEMDPASAMALRLPRKEVLLDYVSRVFVAAQEAVARLSDDEFFAVYECFHGENWHDGQIGPIVVTWMTHDNRHLGMIECLVGFLGKTGSADA
ncbi:MAG TPA: DinB family protein [Anaerolineales bacterium]|nr:DinB family protein [Anaerolineales bacterium]